VGDIYDRYGMYILICIYVAKEYGEKKKTTRPIPNSHQMMRGEIDGPVDASGKKGNRLRGR